MSVKTSDNIHFSRNFTLNYMDCDRRKNIQLHTLMGLFADSWVYSDVARDFYFDDIQKYNQTSVMTKMAIRIHKIPVMSEQITITSWHYGETEKFFHKNAHMTDRVSGELLASARLEAALFDSIKRVAIPISEFSFTTTPADTSEIDAPECRRIIIEEPLPYLGEKAISYTDIDCNNHASNTVYPKLVADYMPLELHDRALKEIGFNFIRETYLGDVLELRGGEIGNGFYMQGLNKNGKLHFCCELLY